MQHSSRVAVALAALVPAGLILLAVSCAGPPPAAPPTSVVLVVVDTLRADHLGCYGYERPTSPHVDALAEEGVRYLRAMSQAPWTTPSVASLLTSLYPTEVGISERPDRLADRFVLLPEILKRHGRATGAVVSHYFLGSKWNLGQGFDVYDESNVRGHEAVTSAGVTDVALEFVEGHREEPFFLFVHYFDPHYDYVEHPGFRFSDPAYDGPVTSGMVYTDLTALRGDLGPADVAHLEALYDSEIAFTDRQVGRLFDGLRERGLWDDSLVVLTADHGEELMERGRIGHGHSLYQELIRVPLIVKYPGGAGAGKVVRGNVGLIDVVPTLLEFLGIEVEHRLSGRSFLGPGPGSEPSPRPVFSETDWSRWRSVVDADLKLMRQLAGDRPARFFNLATDPGERDDLVRHLTQSGMAAPFRRLDARLGEWIAAVETRAAAAEEVEIDDETRRQLEALGYLD